MVLKMNKPAFSRWALESIRSKVKGFDRIDTSELNIKEYKKQFKSLSHVKTGKDFEGVILHENEIFVAVLQCNVKTGYIVALEVCEDYQRQGIAQTLLKLAQNEFKCLKLTVNKKNTLAISLYEKVGYKTFKEEGAMLHMEKQ